MKLFPLALALSSSLAFASDWQLDNTASSLHFVSVKNELVAETHQFNTLSGQWDGNTVRIAIDANSMQTHIPIRNERIWQYVLKTEQFANINVSAELQENQVSSLAVGDFTIVQVPLTLTIAGESATVDAKVRISKLSAKVLQASTEAPVMLNTNSFKLAAGVAKLQELAGLNHIDPLVPVSFTVRFSQQ